MPTKAYSLEDGNLSNKPIITSQTKTYNDIDLSFKKKTTGDVFKKTDAAAVKQYLRNDAPGSKSGRYLDSYWTQIAKHKV